MVFLAACYAKDKTRLYTVIRVIEGDTAKTPLQPVYQGNAFNGWYNLATNESWDFSVPISAITDLYADWMVGPPSSGYPAENKNTNKLSGYRGDNKIETVTIAEGEVTTPLIPHNPYISGYEDSTVRPDNPITRAEVAALVYYMREDRIPDVSEKTAPDVDKNAWYAAAVAYLYNNGIVVGYEDGTFRPAANITRAELLIIVSRIASGRKMEMNAEAVKTFNDISGHWANDCIHNAYVNQYISGYGDGTFRPDNPITRAEAITIINKILQRDYKNGTVTKLEPPYDDLSKLHWAYGEIMEASIYHHCTADDEQH